MIVWLLTVGETMPMLDRGSRKMRTALLAETLQGRGHQVIWWTSTVDHMRKKKVGDGSFTMTWSNGVTVQFVDGPLYTRSISVRRYLNHIIVAWRFLRLARRKARPDIIVSSYPTPELNAAAARVATELGVPFVIDVRDLWPEELVERAPDPLRPVMNGLMLPMRWLLHYAVRRATTVTAVSPSYLAWAERQATGPFRHPPAIFPLGYEVSAEKRDDTDAVKELTSRGVDFSRSLFPYVTTLNSGADLKLAADVAARLAKEGLNAQIVIAGAGGRERELQGLVGDLATVRYVGWLTSEQLVALLARSCAGLVLYHANSRVSLSNKFFEYMSQGLPLIVTLGGDPRKLVREEKMGVCIEPGDADGLFGAISELMRNRALHSEMAARSRSVFASRFDAGPLYRRLADYLEAVEAGALT